MMAPVQCDIDKWLEENKKYFVPPICNKLMYKDGQLKTFFVGGPNSRKDFHMEEGEEFFYMLKGDMRLVVHEQGSFRDIKISEGEVFMLPARVPHSPQRIADTIGLVIERERAPKETDLLRYYIDGTDEILYEKWFHCENLEELGPLIKEYFNSEAYKTGKPIPGSLLEDKPIKQDFERKLGDPFSLQNWLDRHKETLDKEGKKKLFDGQYVSRIDVLGKGEHFPDNDLPETFLWQIEGKSAITVDEKAYEFLKNQTMLIQPGSRYWIQNEAGSRTLSVVMNPV
ncbi:3-hydroxyanthranilate 3,4-dioxygenase [Araneus ventricosus]|uniref:3-hydroxyanthranilate 3,4-dioxygenase n=1 Tax=Araneus ventricosus TaxID=182803 RepID=A0A4Y2B3L5_ARAVE|nr:3-hydroxyanthranilate 3,4-dioxygenase [Araneus ventricosus]